jgi:hypothetical protein
MLTAERGVISKRVRPPDDPRKLLATERLGVQDDTPHHVTVRPTP